MKKSVSFIGIFLCRIIFEEADFDISILGVRRYKQAAARWLRTYNDNGIIGLKDTRKENSVRPTTNEPSKDDIILKQESKIKLLEEQLELLKKLDVTESRLVNNSITLKGNEIFKLINETIINSNFKNMVSYFCELLNVSLSGYYNYLSTIEEQKLIEDKDLEARDNILMAYLSTIKDGSSNDILAYHTSENITLDIATTTINKLMAEHKDSLSKDEFIHSDQGVHYTSPKFQSLLKENTLGQSMSRSGNFWGNTLHESFFGHMKDEVDFKSFQTFDEMLKAIDDYIEYYNNYRYQWNLKKMTPKQYRNHLLLAS